MSGTDQQRHGESAPPPSPPRALTSDFTRVDPSAQVTRLSCYLEHATAALAAAKRDSLAALKLLRFVIGDAHRLPFPTDTFSAARVERVLMHVADPAGVLAEVARTVTPGGRVAAFEPDWDTLVIDADPLPHTRTLTRAWSDHVRHGTIGRQLARLLADAGLSAIDITPVATVLRELPLAQTLLELDTTAADALEPHHADAWLDALHERAAKGRFLAAVTSFHVVARKPGASLERTGRRPSTTVSPPSTAPAAGGAVEDDGLVGTLITPPGVGPWPGVIVLPGSAGGVPEQLARRLAGHGLAALALAYFGLSPLPPTLVEVPLEYVQRAARWLRDRDEVAGEVIGLVGGSKGAELALLCAATFPDLIGPVVAAAPSSVVWHGIELTPGDLATAKPAFRSSWSWQGTPLPFMPAADAAPIHTPRGRRVDGFYTPQLADLATVVRTAIPVERSTGPLLLLSGQDDHLWPSARMGNMLAARMATHSRADDIEHVSYPGAGHALLVAPTAGDAASALDLGGDPDTNAHARAEAWRTLSAFLTRAFTTGREHASPRRRRRP